ncbi:MAG: restriction endonuclease [Bacteroidetes bacterium]|nr:restriction endonuclease [Bacteroidota bacterium]
MKIQFTYSHLNGLEWLLHHHPKLWKEIKSSIESVDSEKCKTKTSKEKTMKGKVLYSPIDMNSEMKKEFESRGWSEERYTYYVTDDHKLTRHIVNLPSEKQKKYIEESGATPIQSYHQTDFVKNRVSVEVQFGKYPFIEFDLFVKHLGFFIGDNIDLGIEIIPTKALQSQMSSGPGYYERTLSHILRQGRGNPSVPLIIIGVEP